jgi:hypothetical protein
VQPDASGRLVFVPDRLTLKRNTLYRLVLNNPSRDYHNFEATDFLQTSLWLLTSMEQQSGETEWYVLPRKLGLFPFYCTVTGHEQMKGVIEVVL